jgi:hypothetical protein
LYLGTPARAFADHTPTTSPKSPAVRCPTLGFAEGEEDEEQEGHLGGPDVETAADLYPDDDIERSVDYDEDA